MPRRQRDPDDDDGDDGVNGPPSTRTRRVRLDTHAEGGADDSNQDAAAETGEGPTSAPPMNGNVSERARELGQMSNMVSPRQSSQNTNRVLRAPRPQQMVNGLGSSPQARQDTNGFVPASRPQQLVNGVALPQLREDTNGSLPARRPRQLVNGTALFLRPRRNFNNILRPPRSQRMVNGIHSSPLPRNTLLLPPGSEQMVNGGLPSPRPQQMVNGISSPPLLRQNINGFLPVMQPQQGEQPVAPMLPGPDSALPPLQSQPMVNGNMGPPQPLTNGNNPLRRPQQRQAVNGRSSAFLPQQMGNVPLPPGPPSQNDINVLMTPELHLNVHNLRTPQVSLLPRGPSPPPGRGPLPQPLHSRQPARSLWRIERIPPREHIRIETQLRQEILYIDNIEGYFWYWPRAMGPHPHFNDLRNSLEELEVSEQSANVLEQLAPWGQACSMFFNADFESLQVAAAFFWWQHVWFHTGKCLIAEGNRFETFHHDSRLYFRTILSSGSRQQISHMREQQALSMFDTVADAIWSTSTEVQRLQFLSCMDEYCALVYREQMIVKNGRVPNSNEYHRLRVDNGHVKILIEVLRIVMALPINPAVSTSAEWEVILNSLGMAMSYMRDLYFLKRDLDANVWTCNAVMIKYRETGEGMDESVKRVVEDISQSMATINRAGLQLHARLVHNAAMAAHLSRVLDSLRMMLSGYWLWCTIAPLNAIQEKYRLDNGDVEIPLAMDEEDEDSEEEDSQDGDQQDGDWQEDDQ